MNNFEETMYVKITTKAAMIVWNQQVGQEKPLKANLTNLKAK